MAGALDPGLTTGDHAAAPGCGQSFTAATLVVVASGAAVPISRLAAGEHVKAVNTRTGKNDVKTIQAVLVKWDTDLFDLDVRTARGTEVIDTTSSHLFWDPAARKWVKASALKKGEHLKTDDGQNATADGDHTPADHNGWMWDLTIQDDHDFYVLPAGDGSDAAYYHVSEDGVTAVLAHNDSCPMAWTQARRLGATRDDPTNSTVAVATVRSKVDPGITDTWVATEQSGLPAEWKRTGAPHINARYIFGTGHAEDTIMNALGSDWELADLASSTRMCQTCYSRAAGMG